MTADLVDQAFTWLHNPIHVSLAAVVLTIPTLLWRFVIHGTIHDRTPMCNATEHLFDLSDDCGNGGTDQADLTAA